MNINMETPQLALTFDDVLLVPQESNVLPSEVSVRTHLGRDLYLNTPILSAAMDTVTEGAMATRMAQLGGLGVVHKNLSPEAQRREVEKVKKYEAGVISEPLTLSPTQSVDEALAMMQKHSISGLPVVDAGKLVGILTHRDLRFEMNTAQPVHDVMTRNNLITAPQGTTLKQAEQILHQHRIEKLPVVDHNMKLVGLITIKDIEKATLYPQATKDAQGRLFVGAAVGVGEQDRQLADTLCEVGVDLLTIDTAHGHSSRVMQQIKYLRRRWPKLYIVGGNVVTYKGAHALFEAGADIIKVGVGGGSICTTRIVAGVGVPQITALQECGRAVREAKKSGNPMIADGGIKFSGDVVKALAVGSGAVMLGSLLAGTDESPGEMILYQGRSYKLYRGMGSLGAMRFEGSRSRYKQSDVNEAHKLVPEGIEGRVPYKGALSSTLHQLVGGVRSGLGYVGACDLEQLRRRAQFVRISPQSLRESHVHDVTLVKEAPNYRV